SPSPESSKEDKDQNNHQDKKAPAKRGEQTDDRPVRRLVPREAVAKAQPEDVLSADVEDFETQKHVERAQMLLRAIRNTEVAADETVDVSFEKELSRQLLSENLVLRRNAEANGKFPEKSLLSSLEPFLIDIANLPEQAKADDLRAVKDRVTRTEIV